jgi:hypothetical protein
VDAKKAAIVILVLIAILFAVILLASSSNKEKDQTALDKRFSFQAFFDGFTNKREVLPAELGGSEFVIPAGKPFVATIQKAGGVRVRRMFLEMTRGTLIQINLKPNGDYGVEVDIKLKPGFTRSPELQVFEGGAVLTATCGGPDPVLKACELQLTK